MAEADPDRFGQWRRWRVAAGAVAMLAVLLVAVLALGRDDGRSDADSTTVTRAPVTTTTSPREEASPFVVDDAVPTLASATSTISTTTDVASVDAPTPTAPPQDEEAPAVVARPVPAAAPADAPPAGPPPPWALTRTVTAGGHVSTDLGCADGIDAGSLDRFFAQRLGPVLGWDYQHIYPLGQSRHLWLFQDTFVDHTGTAGTLGQSSFIHNAAMIQDGRCFRLLHRGTPDRPAEFELGTGSSTLSSWFWPKGGELIDGRLHVFWVQMAKDAVDPLPPDGLGWHPTVTWRATYDPVTLARTSFEPATDRGVLPVYGYAMQSDAEYTYLFGNTFEQNLSREGGFWNGPHSATKMYLARVPRGRLGDSYEYRTADGWSPVATAAVPILQRHWSEFPMQPRLVDGQWVAATAVNGYWGDELEIDVANDPWGPWTTIRSGQLYPRGFDPLRNTYHAHLAPWRDGAGNLVVTVSNNARNMLRDAWPNPSMYRPIAFATPWVAAPPRPAPTTTTTSTTTTSTTTTTTSTTTTTTPSTSSTVAASTTTEPTASTSTTLSTTTSAVPSTSEVAAPSTSEAVSNE